MSVLIYREPKSVGVSAATLLCAEILKNPAATIGVDYHENLLTVYESLSAMTENGLLSWNEVRVFQLFEFLADESKEQRIANLLGKALFAKTDISDTQYAVPFADANHADDVAAAFEQSMRTAGGLDTLLLAVRQDGALLMNHTAGANPFTHMESEEGNGFITAGLTALMQAKHLIVVGIGSACAQAVKTMLQGSITESPLAALKMHPNVTFILDEEASVML